MKPHPLGSEKPMMPMPSGGPAMPMPPMSPMPMPMPADHPDHPLNSGKNSPNPGAHPHDS